MSGVKGRSGRPSKSEEQKMVETLSPLIPKVYKAIEEGVEKGNFKYVQLVLNYLYGKPHQAKEVSFKNPSDAPNINITWQKTDE